MDSGYVLFKYGLVDSQILKSPNYKYVTISQMIAEATVVKAFIEKYKKLPSNVIINGVQWEMPTYFHFLLNSLLNINKGSTNAITIVTFRPPLYTSSNSISGTMVKTDYLSLAQNIQNFMDINGAAPKYMETKQGQLHYESLVYIYSSIINYYGVNKVLPKNVTIKHWFNSEPIYYY